MGCRSFKRAWRASRKELARYPGANGPAVEEPSDALFDRGIDGSDAWSILEFWFSADTGLGFS